MKKLCSKLLVKSTLMWLLSRKLQWLFCLKDNNQNHVSTAVLKQKNLDSSVFQTLG